MRSMNELGATAVVVAIAALSQACGSGEKCPPAAPEAPSPSAPPAHAPVATTMPAQPPPGVFHVQVAKDGTLAIQGAHIASLAELGERARASAKSRPDLLVMIEAEPQTPFKHVAEVHDVAKRSGFSRIGLAQGKAPSGPASAPPQKTVPTLAAGESWKCNVSQPVERLEEKSAFIAIHVGPDGAVQTVDILEDPGSGLGEAARICALNRTFEPALDANGKPTVGVKKLRLHFQRR